MVTTIIHVPEGMDATETELKTLCCFSARLPYLADLTAAQPEVACVRLMAELCLMSILQASGVDASPGDRFVAVTIGQAVDQPHTTMRRIRRQNDFHLCRDII